MRANHFRAGNLLLLIVCLAMLVLAGNEVLAEEEDKWTSDESAHVSEESIIIEDGVSFTPEGNLTLVDDIQRSDDTDKQFITVETRDGSLFFIVIDRSANRDNVYFLNLVDDADLIALLKDPELTKEIEDLMRMPEITTVPEENNPEINDPVTAPKSALSGKGPALIVLILVAGGAVFWIVRYKPFTQKRQQDFAVPEYVFADENDLDESVESEVNQQDGPADKDE
jgi:hypothetical protein